MDKLWDITICRCDITLCTDTSSPYSGQFEPCKTPGGFHIKCIGLLPFKLPPHELAWILKQRNKVGEVSEMDIAGNDAKETTRQLKAIESYC